MITWFQNRRAKLKRDLEELKNDVVATKQLSVKSGSSDHEFSIDSDSDSPSTCRPLHMSPKRSKSESRSPEPEITRPRSAIQSISESTEDHECESTEEIVVDDKDDVEGDQGS